jgi:chromosome partitioning protein
LPLRKSGYHAYYTHCLISFVNDGLSARADDDFLNLTANCFYTVSLKGNEVESMAVVAIASHKGGVSKTTLAILLGAEFALDGYRVTVLDCDLNQHASAFGLKAKLPNFSVVPDIGEKEVLKALRTAEDDKDIVLIDLPGGSSTLGLKAISRSHFVLVPMRPSLPDARDAMKTVAQIDDAEELARVPIPRALVWTLFRAGFESKVSRHVRTSL